MKNPILSEADEVRLNEIRLKVKYWESRKVTAKELLPATGGWYFILSGLKKSSFSFTFTKADTLSIKLRPVKQPPLLEEVAAATKSTEHFYRIAGYCPIIKHELAIYGDACDWNFASVIAYYIFAAYRIKSGACFIVPMAGNYPWDSIPAVEQSTLDVHILEDYPTASIFGQKHTMNEDDFFWVDAHFLDLYKLANDHPQIEIAIDAISTFNQQSGLRMSVVSLWAGIEALMGIQSELRYRLSIQIAVFLEQEKTDRISMYKKIRKMYDDRSKVVHGGTIINKNIVQHIIEAKEILCKILIRIIENNRMPTSDDFDEQLLE